MFFFLLLLFLGKKIDLNYLYFYLKMFICIFMIYMYPIYTGHLMFNYDKYICIFPFKHFYDENISKFYILSFLERNMQ